MNEESFILNSVISILSCVKEWYFDFRLREISEPSGLSSEDLETTTLLWVNEYLSSNLVAKDESDRKRVSEIVTSEIIKWTTELEDYTKKHPYLLVEQDNEVSAFKSELNLLYQLFTKNQIEITNKKKVLHFRESLGLSQKEYDSFMENMKQLNCFDENNRWLKDEQTNWFLSFREALFLKGYKVTKKTPMAQSFCETYKYNIENERTPLNISRNASTRDLIAEFESKIPNRNSL